MKNNSRYGENRISNIVFWAIGFMLFLPIIVLPPNFQPSDWTRSMLFRMMITALVSFLLFKFFYKKDISISLPKWKISTYLPMVILAVFFTSVVIATIFSQDITLSIFGSPSRSGGALNLFFFFLFSVLLAIFISKDQWQKLFHMLFIGGILASLLAIVQYFNLLKNVFLSYEGGSTPSFLGNSTILATYMLFLSFLAFVFFIQKRTKKGRAAYGALFLLFTFTIIITGSRAAYLALLIGFLYFFLLYPYPQKYKRLKIAAVSILLFSILAIALFNVFPQLGEKSSILKTISTRVSIARIAKDIFGTRLSAWKMTWQAISEKPLLGWGPENFYIGFEKHYDPVPFATPKLLWDRPHNIVLDVAVHSGILSLLLYTSFWIALLWKLQRVKRPQLEDGNQTDTTLKAHVVHTMFLSYLVVLFFNFDSFATYLLSFFFIGYSFYLIWLPEEKILFTPPHSIPLKKPTAIIFLATVILFFWFWNIKPLYLNEKIVHAKNLSSQGRCKEALDISNGESWENSGILKSYAILLYSDIIKNCAYVEPQKEVAYSEKMVSLLKVAANTQPTFSRTWLFMGSFTNVLAARETDVEKKKKLLIEATGYLHEALKLSPKRQEIFAEMAKSHLIAENYSSMEALGKECITIDPRGSECYWQLGIAQIFLGNQEEGKQNTEQSFKNGYITPPYKQLAVAYMSQKNWIEAVTAYEKIPIYYDPESTDVAASHHATLAYLYKQSGNYTKAGEEALKVFNLQPDNPETVQFIKLLLAQSPSDPIINSSLAFIYAQPGPRQEALKAIAIYKQLIGNYPNNPDYRWRLIEIYYEQKEYDRAYAEVILVLKLFPERKEQVETFIKKLLPIHWENYTHGVGF